MTDDTGPRPPATGGNPSWARPHPPADDRPGPPPERDPGAPWARSGDPAAPGSGGAGPPRPEGGDPRQTGPRPDDGRAPHSGASVTETGQWAAPPSAHRQPPAGPGGSGGPGAPGGPGGSGGPGAPGGPPPGGAYSAPFGAGPPRPPRRGVPVWAVLLIVLVVGLASAGIGGAVGGSLGVQAGASDRSESPRLNTAIPTDTPSRAPDTIAGVAQRVSPSVVLIQDGGSGGLSGNGSGFVIEDDHVVTNNHVASALAGSDIEVVYSDGRASGARIVGTEPASDLAVLELADPIDVQPLEFGDSAGVTVGDQVIAIGAPLGLAGTVTSGIISAVDRPVSLGEGEGPGAAIEALQTDAAINPGNSGGPLVDAQGRVIGVNTAIATLGGGPDGEQGGSIGLGFAIPSSQVEQVVDDIIAGGGSAPPPAGGDQQAAIGAVFDTTHTGGALIAEENPDGSPAVPPGSPAEQAGLEPGDVITAIGGEEVADFADLQRIVGEHAPGDRVEVVFERDGREQTTEVTLGAAGD
ncbi:trypsin-like peptidase domain-containing protein [Streptomonospora nanhaiensis]|uniref:Putative serine protease PepD n=3 Tax=Streptomonospora nanhaiensis TaxID=1323731 RepID=A0A853BQD3_9ACTN|nr:trypsin-like peptidase domain-containing protein [Streptomonospora nanhaiensis]MBV2362760.1 trypsin-like peptidase domain-containing protein [Streptomonospora nanhaiensis]NYI97889.1 putative serine protease PepD [Streptomonospora nanhaiensis]